MHYLSETLYFPNVNQANRDGILAIGGDLSSMNVNPAGSSIFNYNQATISLTSFNKSNNASYFGTNSRTQENSLDINQLGAVFVFNDNAANSIISGVILNLVDNFLITNPDLSFKDNRTFALIVSAKKWALSIVAFKF